MFKNAILPSILRTHFLDLGLESFFNKIVQRFRPINITDQHYIGLIEEEMCFRKAFDQVKNETYYEVEIAELYHGMVFFFAYCYDNPSDRAYSVEGSKGGYDTKLEHMCFYEPYEIDSLRHRLKNSINQ